MKRKSTVAVNQTGKRVKLEITDSLFRVFGNSVFLRHLDKFLDLEDLKNLRLVNRQFNSNVLLHTTFTSRIFFTINKNLISSRILANINFPIKMARVECFRADSSWNRMCRNYCEHIHQRQYRAWDSDDEQQTVITPPSKVWFAEEIEHIYNALDYVEDLSIHNPASLFRGSCVCDLKTESAFQLFPSINRIIRSSSKTLLTLKLESQFSKHVLGDYDGSLKPYLQKITHLELRSIDGGGAPDSLEALRELEHLTLDSFHKIEADAAVLEQLVRFNFKTIRSLTIINCVSEFTEKFWTRLASLQFVNLIQLEIEVSDQPILSLALFLQNQNSALQSLTLNFSLIGEGNFPSAVLDVVPTIIDLRELRLRVKYTGASDSIPTAWLSTLKLCRRLECLEIVVSELVNPGWSISQIFNYVPDTLKSVTISGDSRMDNDIISEQSIMKMRNLTSLSLCNCVEALTDRTLQAIFTTLTLLKDLRLTPTRRCSSATFTGHREGFPNSVSIKNLKRLEKLVIQESMLYDADIYKCIEFPKLKYLDISNNFFMTRSLRIRYILNRNPFLEFLCLEKVNKYIYTREDMATLKIFYPRLQQIQFKTRFKLPITLR